MQLTSVLEQEGIPYEMHVHSPSFSAQELASAEHVSGYSVAKPVVVKGATSYAMCVVPAPLHVDLNKAARALGEPSVRLATEKEMDSLFPDCERGAEPPVGSMFGMRTIADEHLRDGAVLVMQAGTHTESVTIREADWERICRPDLSSIAV